MPPHIFHALSDDPARWERQFGCMAALFQMFEQHPRVFSRRGAQLASNTSSAEHSHSKPSSKSSRNHCKDGTDTIASSAQKRSSERGHPAARPSGSSTPATTNKGYPKVQPKASCPQRSKNDSPSILDSSRATATIREPPRKSFDASPECCSSASSRSLPGSPYVGPKTRDGRSQVKMLFDQPRASLDGGREQLVCGVAASGRRDGYFDSVYRDPLNGYAGDGLCKDPLQELKESIRALAKLQQATQEFVDRFESQRLSDDKLGDHMSSTGSASRINASRSHAQGPDLPGITINSSEAARTSSFDYTEAVRISQKIQETPARLSLDGRELIPKSVLKLREAMRSRLNVGEMNCSPGHQKKSMSLRSALATKEDFIPPAKDIITTTPRNSSARGHRSSSNVIARLMGLDDIPRPDSVAKPEKPSAEPRLLKDLLRCPPQGDRFGNHVQSRGNCCEGTKEEQTQSCDADVVSKLAKIEALANTEALQKGPILREDDCKVISVVKKQAKTHQDVNSSRPMAALKHALEVMPSTSPKLERRRAAIAAGVNVPQQHQREYAEQKVEDSSRLERQSVKGFQDEVQRRLRQVVALENSLTERKTLNEIVEAMQLKGLLHAQIKKKPEPGGKKLDYPLEKPSIVKKHEQISRMMLGDDQVAEGHFLTDKSNTSTGGGAGFLGGESTIVVMKPCKTRTLSMETHFPFDVPTISAAVDVDHVLSSPSQPKQGGAAAKVLASGIANNLFRTSIRQRNVANHRHAGKVDDKSTHDQTEGATRSPMSNAKCQNNSKAANGKDRKVPIEPAPIPSTRCSSPPSRKGIPPKQPAAKLGTGSDQHLQAACTDKIKSQSVERMSALSNRKKRSLENIKKSISKFSAFAATTGVGASKVAGVDKVGKNHRKIRKGESQLLGAQDDAARTLECAQAGQLQASSHPHGYSTESGLASTEMNCQPRDSLHPATRDVADGLPASGGCPFSRLSLSAATTKVAVDLPELSRSNSGTAAPELLSPISVLDTGYDDGADLSPPASTNNNATHDATRELAEEDLKAAAPLNGQFEYVKAILQRAGLLADKEEAVLGAWMGAGCAIRPAVFLELERTWRNTESPEVENGGQQRRLIFDCIHEILTDKFDGMGACGSGRGLVRAAWRDLQRLAAPPAAVKCKSKRDRLYLLLQRDLEQSKDAGWTSCSAPIAHISLVLEEAIFQDLLLEVHSEFLQPSLV